MSVTHHSLMALVLTLDEWDLPLVVHRCYRWLVAPIAAVLFSKSFFGCILLKSLECWKRWRNHCTYHYFTITNTSTYEIVEDAFIFRAHFIKHKTIKRNTKLSRAHSTTLSLKTQFESIKSKTYFKIKWNIGFYSLHRHSRK